MRSELRALGVELNQLLAGQSGLKGRDELNQRFHVAAVGRLIRADDGAQFFPRGIKVRIGLLEGLSGAISSLHCLAN